MGRWFFFLLLLAPALAYSNADSIVVNYGGYNRISAVHLSDRAELLNVTQNIYLYPQDGVVISESLNNLSVRGNYLFFNKQGDFDSSGWSFNYTVMVNRLISRVNSNPVFPYPVNDLPLPIIDYLAYDNFIDYSPEIKGVADEIVSGVSDYLTAVLLLSEWVNVNLDYSFVEPFVSGTLKASQVLTSRRGVCDEYSVLFASLARSVGIPVRYVTGYSYGNILDLSEFGPHAWVEFYVPGHGWVSTDPTYGTHGWVDASHVSVHKSWNVSGNFISTYSTGYYLDELNLSNHLPDFMTSSFGSQASGFNIFSVNNESLSLTGSLTLSKEVIGEGEYFFINFSINNPNNYYLPLSYSVVSTGDMFFVNASNSRSILLKPNSTTSSFVIMRSPFLGLNVLHPIQVYAPLAGDFEVNVRVNPALAPSSSIDEIILLTSQDKLLLEDVELIDLRVSPNLTYGDESNLFLSFRNKGNSVVNNLSISVFSDLTSDSEVILPELGINEVMNLSVPLNITGRGEGFVRVYINYANETLFNETFLIAPPKPLLDFNYVGDDSFSVDPFFILRVINQNMVNVPLLNVTIITPRESLTKSFSLGKVTLYEIETAFPESWLAFGDNSVRFIFNYFDDYGTHFSSEFTRVISREGEWWELILDWITNLINNILS